MAHSADIQEKDFSQHESKNGIKALPLESESPAKAQS